MTDKEVGELWIKRHQCQNEFYARKIGELIRKLVEERAYIIYLKAGTGLLWEQVAASYLWNARNDFGIAQEEWNQWVNVGC